MDQEQRNKGKPGQEIEMQVQESFKDHSPIAWQNKDVTSKVLADGMRGKALEAYGLHLPEVIDVKPTNLPAVEANELRLDNLFYFEDDSVGIIDYENDAVEENKVKYLGYIARIMKRIYNEEKRFRRIRIIIIYTGDVLRGNTLPDLDLVGFSLHLQESFLSDIPREEIRSRIKEKIDHDEALDDIDLMHLIVYPMSYQQKDEKERAVSEAIGFAEQIAEPSSRLFALTGIRTFADKIIKPEDIVRIERGIGMVHVIEDYVEKTVNERVEQRIGEAVKEAVKKVEQEAKRKADERAKKIAEAKAEKIAEEKAEKIADNAIKQVAKKFLDHGESPEKISECTGLPISEVLQLQETTV